MVGDFNVPGTLWPGNQGWGFRKGVWGGINGTLFEHYPEMTKEIHAASDHAALFVDLDI